MPRNVSKPATSNVVEISGFRPEVTAARFPPCWPDRNPAKRAQFVTSLNGLMPSVMTAVVLPSASIPNGVNIDWNFWGSPDCMSVSSVSAMRAVIARRTG